MNGAGKNEGKKGHMTHSYIRNIFTVMSHREIKLLIQCSPQKIIIQKKVYCAFCVVLPKILFGGIVLNISNTIHQEGPKCKHFYF